MFKRLKWGGKLLRSRNFLVMTDDEAVINFEGKPPYTFDDGLELADQAQTLELFRDNLAELSKEHDEMVGEIMSTFNGDKHAPAISETEIKQASKRKARKS